MILTTEDQIKSDFMSKLKGLLSEYSDEASLEVRDDWTGYAECGQQLVLELYIPPRYDTSGDLVHKGFDIRLPTYIDAK